MSLTKYNNMTSEQVIALIEDCVADGLARQEEICSALQELGRRGVRHKLHKHPLYKWFNEVADRKLAMSVVALYSGKKAYLDHLVGRPIDTQRQIVSELPIDVAQMDRNTNRILAVRKPVIRLNLADFKRVFPLGKPPATFAEQKAALEVELAAQPVTRTQHGPIVRAIKEESVLMVGTVKVPLSVIRTALIEIGAKVTLPKMEM